MSAERENSNTYKAAEAQEMVLTVLKARFGEVSADVEKAVNKMVYLEQFKN